MDRRLLGILVAGLVGGAAYLSGGSRPQPPEAPADVRVAVEEQNPWTHLRLNNDPAEFQFAIVSDRTGGHRPGVFRRAVDVLNLLQPQFVLSVGDLVEGYTQDRAVLDAQWREFAAEVGRLQMPFFYVPGNHDLSNKAEVEHWKGRFGRRYYHFLYRDVLFLMLNSEDTPARAAGRLGAAQVEYARKVLADNPGVRWTVVVLHRPLWTHSNVAKTRWPEVEKALEGRRYTVFAGHLHSYRKYVRNGMNYYQLATTGGGSKLRGLEYGEFDQVAWVTMKKYGPVVANVLLDGVYPDDLAVSPSDEKGLPERRRKQTYAAAGSVLRAGKPVASAEVVLYSQSARTRRYSRVADALTDGEGNFRLSTFRAFDGVPEGEYTATVTQHEPRFDAVGRPTRNLLHDRYSQPHSSPLIVRIRKTGNHMELRLED